MTISPELEPLALETAELLRDLPKIDDLDIPEHLAVKDIEVALPTRNRRIVDCWLDKGIAVKGLSRTLVPKCIEAGVNTRLFIARAGVVLQETEIKGHTLVNLKERVVKCYKQVLASDLASQLTDAQLKDVYNTLVQIARRRKNSDATDA